jgi:hypothetical protein
MPAAIRNVIADNNQITTSKTPKAFPGLLIAIGECSLLAKKIKTPVTINRTTASMMELLPV